MTLTFVFPCLNEEATLGGCIDEVRASLDANGVDYEIVVADNGSTDRSREIAKEKGARVVPVEQRGYGAALKGGIAAAASEYVMFADADSTYLLGDAGPLFAATKAADADMGIASRMKGKIEAGAMPTLHRYLGTPVLTTMINVLFGGRLSDCNSGFRCLRKTAYESWDVRSDGMEFASELLIKALRAGASTVEIPSGLRPGPADRVAHLRTWRDGMRHMLFILSEKPKLFEVGGLALILFATLLQGLAAVTGPVAIGGLHVFDFHSQALLLLAGLWGTQLYLFSCVLFLRGRQQPTRLTAWLIGLDEGVLFFLLLVLTVGVLGVVTAMVLFWAAAGFADIGMIRVLLVLVHFLSIPGLLAIALLGIHVFKKSGREG